MNLVYIHGSHASADSFNFIRSKLPGHNDILLDYDSSRGFYTNHALMLERLDGLEDVFFIAHSLGGYTRCIWRMNSESRSPAASR